MRIQTTNLDKGGGGKSSHTYNEGDWLSRVMGKRVLLIDGARECNLTHSFDVTSDKTIYDIFITGEYEICRINDKLSLIRGDEQREHMTEKQKQDHQKFYDNIEYVYQNILTVLEGETK